MWSGLGFNVKTPLAKVDQDIAFFNETGVTTLRMHVPDITDTTEVDYWKAVTKRFTDANFYTIWGATPRDITAANWTALAQQIKDLALVCQQQGVCSEFQIGNECESHCDNTTMTRAALRANLRTLATEVKTIFTRGPVSYAVEGTALENGYGARGPLGSQLWCDEGTLGGLDYLTLNAYGVGRPKAQYNDIWEYYKPVILQARATFGNKTYVSEFNLEGDNSQLSQIPLQVQTMWLKRMLNFIKASGMSKAIFFQWCGYKRMDNQFVIKRTDESLSTLWDVLAENKRRTLV